MACGCNKNKSNTSNVNKSVNQVTPPEKNKDELLAELRARLRKAMNKKP